MKKLTYQLLSDEERTLLDAAEQTMLNAYNPYSNFFVGAALLNDKGLVVTGSNVENSSYGCSICAERSAISSAVSGGSKTFSIIAVIGQFKDHPAEDAVSPCGICRQVISEFAVLNQKDIKIILSNTAKTVVLKTSIEELLPLAFSKRDLL